MPTTPRSFEHHAALYAAYAARVALLTPAAWDRMRRQCADLNGPSFRAMVNRTIHTAKPYDLWFPTAVTPRPVLRAIRGASRVVQTSLDFAYQVASEFESTESRLADVSWSRTQSSARRRRRRRRHAAHRKDAGAARGHRSWGGDRGPRLGPSRVAPRFPERRGLYIRVPLRRAGDSIRQPRFIGGRLTFMGTRCPLQSCSFARPHRSGYRHPRSHSSPS